MLNQNPSKKMGVFKTLLVIPLLGFFLLSFNVEKVYQYPISAEGQQNASDKSVELVIGKDTSNEELAKMKQNLAKDGIDFSYTAVRNDKMEIVDITVHISGKHSKGETFSSNYSSNSDSPIQPLIIFYDDEANVVSFGGAKHKRIQIHNSVDHTMHLNSLDEKEVVIKEENDTKKIFVDGKEVNEEDLDEMGFHIKTDDTDKHVSVHVLSDETSDEHIKIRKRAKSDKNTVVIKNSDDAEYIDVVSDVDIEVMGEAKDYLFIDTDGEAEPLYYIDGKKAKAKDFHKLSPSEIKSINVSKGEGAIKKYGKKAKNGVVEITTKNGN